MIDYYETKSQPISIMAIGTSKMYLFTFVIKQEELPLLRDRPCEGRLSSTVPWERKGEIPLRDPTMHHFKATANLRQFFFTLTAFLSLTGAHGQTNSCDKVDKDLTRLYKKIFPFYYGNQDSLIYYSDLFATKLTSYVKSTPLTFECKFKSFRDSVGSIATTSDGSLRIYSWDTQTGGTMHRFKNLFQFKSHDTVYVKDFDYGDGDMGSYFTDIYSLSANGKHYFLSIAGGSESSKDVYEFIKVYSISANTLNDSVPLIKTPSGLSNSIVVEYDFFSVMDRPERPIRLIKYDPDKKMIYIPIILEGGKVTDRFILYQFNGQYFEKILTQKKSNK